jgi:outer membrane protein, heavy metal efflux system
MDRFILIILCLNIFSATICNAQDRITSLSLEEAVTLATRENFTLRAAQFEYQATRANEVTAGLIPNPSFSYLGEQLNEPSIPTAAGSGQQYTVTIGQTFETGGKRQRRLDSARAATLVAGHTLTGVEQQVLFQVKKSFTDVLTAKAALELAEQNLKTIGEIERIQSLRVAKGDLSELELLRIQVQQYSFQRDAADARQAIQAAKNTLRTFAGPDRIADEYDVTGKLDFRDFTFNKPDLYSLAQVNRPDIRTAEAAREKARADINLAKANAWWDLTPLVEYRRDGKFNTVGAGISFPIRIFDRNQGEILRTSSEARSVEATYQGTVAQALSEVDTALTAMLTERQKVTALRDNYLPKAQKAGATVDFAYRRGGSSLLDFLDAQRTYRETSLEYVRSLGNYWTTLYQLELAVGGSLIK